MIFISAIAEEVIWRVYIQSSLAESYADLGILYSAALFFLFHVDAVLSLHLVKCLDLFIFCIFISIAWDYTGDFYYVVVVHSLRNLSIFTLNVKA
ncbi:lysostaphin resistance A-like protein [Pantoea ananatis]|uniref:CPBP family intramembrane glutamic endopeptidase n=1 Tax=Pantoea ananas TaxID=553 RepID=UPI003D15938D